jgi:hypothetical protein
MCELSIRASGDGAGLAEPSHSSAPRCFHGGRQVFLAPKLPRAVIDDPGPS